MRLRNFSIALAFDLFSVSCSHLPQRGTLRKFFENFVASGRNLAYRLGSFLRLFWGEQPPFMPIGRGGR